MNLKKKLTSGIATALLGMALIGGGTFAYFSDTTEQTNTFASGTLSLESVPEVVVNLDNLKPGDTIQEEFGLLNDGSLDIGSVTLKTDYTVKNASNNMPVDASVAEAYGDAMMVQFLRNTGGDKPYEVIFELTVNQLVNMTEDDIEELLTEIDIETIRQWIPLLPWPFDWIGYWEKNDIPTENIKTLEPGETAPFDVRFEFVDSGESQNELQNLKLDLKWTFEGFQTEGEER
ncbi:TasA family protein [Oceanobacillus alkalisoli]|uniref:TasA family protein n=1 Tax=Oceanobacillus alkalisoli TaxID=2925113 RepID=UPI001EEFD2C0|nr:TasA family protein [Oceanobacillus alkalisoli]MCF3943423.1 CalY family protein [Oceanobacillus alkalisoli]MCG5104012.1 CalY family protein [Oceanobacillus alkalisoli]